MKKRKWSFLRHFFLVLIYMYVKDDTPRPGRFLGFWCEERERRFTGFLGRFLVRRRGKSTSWIVGKDLWKIRGVFSSTISIQISYSFFSSLYSSFSLVVSDHYLIYLEWVWWCTIFLSCFDLKCLSLQQEFIGDFYFNLCFELSCWTIGPGTHWFQHEMGFPLMGYFDHLFWSWIYYNLGCLFIYIWFFYPHLCIHSILVHALSCFIFASWVFFSQVLGINKVQSCGFVMPKVEESEYRFPKLKTKGCVEEDILFPYVNDVLGVPIEDVLESSDDTGAIKRRPSIPNWVIDQYFLG